MSRTRQHKPARRVWSPMTKGLMSQRYKAAVYPDGWPPGVTRVEVWSNDEYDATVEHHESGWSYITLKRRDRVAVRDWRHLQSIKNEIVGPEREAFELFPAESRLMDEANQYHLWCLPEGESISFGPTERHVLTKAEHSKIPERGKGRQRAWQPGLSTGPVES